MSSSNTNYSTREWDIIVTRHVALVELLKEREIVTNKNIKIISHATEKDISGKNVLGVLPLSLASKANLVGEIELNLTPELRGKELDLETLRKVAGALRIYQVREI